MRTVSRWLGVAAALAAAAGSPWAQPSAAAPPAGSGARAIALPDTMGANFSIADSATKAGATGDFDFLDGMWHFRFQQRKPDGTFRDPFTGHWSAHRKNTAGAMVEDHWRPDNAGAAWEGGTYTYRVYDPQRKLWAMQGVGSERGVWQPGVAWSDSASRYVVQRYGTAIMRIRYFDITPTHFLWRGDISEDGGKSWVRDWWTMEATRIGK